MAQRNLSREKMPTYFKVMLAVGLAACVGSGCHPTRDYPLSDHFNGRQFHNPHPTPPQSFWQVAGHLFFDAADEWPKGIAERHGQPFKGNLLQDEMVVTWINHATVLIQFADLNVLTDPVWSKRVGPVSWAGSKRAVEPGIAFKDLPKIDLVVISHNHFDHMDLPTLRRLEKHFSPQFIVPLGTKLYLEKRGLKKVESVDWWQEGRLGQLRWVFTPAQHHSARGLWTERDSLWGSFWLEMGKASIYFAGDTAYEAHFLKIRERLGSPDVALLPIGAYLPRKMTEPYHLDPAQAVMAHQELGARQSIAIHYGTFQLTAENFDQPVKDLEQARAAAALIASSFITPLEGENLKMHQEDSETGPLSLQRVSPAFASSSAESTSD